MARRCSHCNHDGHNSRTCPNRGVRVFGVRLIDGSLQKSASTGNLAIFARSADGGASVPVVPLDPSLTDACNSGYASEGVNVGSSSHERKKGVPWTEHEHKMFLLGLKKLGKGDWRGIARSFVISRTPTQVASHAQKYFIRHSANNRRKRRVSLFDIVGDEASAKNLPSSSQEQEMQDTSSKPVLQISEDQADIRDSDIHKMTMKCTYPPPIYPIFIPLHKVSDGHTDVRDNSAPAVEGADLASPTAMQFMYSTIYPGIMFPGFPCPMPYVPSYAPLATVSQSHEIIKPTAAYSKRPIKIDELLGMSSLSLGECCGEAGPLMLRPSPVGSSQRLSAFQSGASSGSSRLDSSSCPSPSPIHAT